MMMSEERIDPRATPERTCAGCGGKGLPEDMVRVVRGPEGEIVADVSGGGFGRGAHVHPGCIDKACKGGFARTFKAKVTVDEGELRDQIRDAVERRIAGLLLGARRAGHVAIGNDAACEALETGAFAVVACDAGSVAQKHEVVRAVSEGRAVSFGDKVTLGSLMGHTEVAIVAVTHLPLGHEIKKCLDLAGGSSSKGGEQPSLEQLWKSK